MGGLLPPGVVMSVMVRNLLAVVIASLIAGGIIVMTETLGARALTPPSDAKLSDLEQLKAMLEAGQVPFTHFLLVLGGWLLGAYSGGRAAWRLSRSAAPVWLFAIVFVVGMLSHLSGGDHPAWMWVGGLGLGPLVALAGGGESLAIRA